MDPEMTVVVASFSGEAALARCLESLRPQSARVQVVAATDVAADAVERLQRRFPGFEFCRSARPESVFALRALGARQARAPFVALTEDHCTVAADWVETLLQAHRGGHAVVGGPVENGLTSRGYDWALYFCEYGIYMPPLPAGPASILSGLNVSYRRELLDACREVWQDALYESDVNGVLERAGHRLHRAAALVTSHLEMPLRDAMAHLRNGARRYGARRLAGSGPVHRVLLPIGVIAVPAVLGFRILRAVASRRPDRLGVVLKASPYIACLLLAWSAGEAAGYLRGAAPAEA